MEVITKSPNLSTRASEDYDLVLLAIDGNQKSYAELMDRYRISVYNTMYKMVSNREDAEDLTIEAFGKAFNKLQSYAPHYAFSTWLFKIAINNCIDHIRKRKLQLLSIDEHILPNSSLEYSQTLKANNLDPEERVIRQQRVNLMRNVLKKLTSKYRLMIELRFFEELSYEEIAAIMDCPVGTVRPRIFRAREAIDNKVQPLIQR